MEKWKDVVGFENEYQVSSYGRVKSKGRYIDNNGGKQYWQERIMRPRLNDNGYMIASLSKKGSNLSKKKRVHRLVAEAFINTNNLKLDINHIDGDKQNNRLENLEWVDRSANLKHAYRTGLRVSTFKDKPSVNRKLTDEQVIKARQDRKGGATTVAIAKELGISQASAYDMLTNKTYKEVV